MNTIYKTQYKIMKQTLNIEHIISIRFSDIKPKKYKKYQDTACTALARSLQKNVLTYIDRKMGQLCPGGDYFLGINHPSEKQICDVYVKDEKVFGNNNVCLSFLKKLPQYHALTKKRYVLFTPIAKEKNKPDVVEFLATPAQTSRILGLSVYKKMSYPVITPALSTCASILAPIASGGIHLNFIDYFDRYYQGRQNGKLLWKDSNLIISMPFNLLQSIIECIHLSAHGTFKPKMKPHKVDSFD